MLCYAIIKQSHNCTVPKCLCGLANQSGVRGDHQTNFRFTNLPEVISRKATITEG
jgi:hypothetical protein